MAIPSARSVPPPARAPASGDATTRSGDELDQLRFLHEVARLATTARTWDELLETVVDGTRDALHADVSSLYLLARDGAYLTLAATHGLVRVVDLGREGQAGEAATAGDDHAEDAHDVTIPTPSQADATAFFAAAPYRRSAVATVSWANWGNVAVGWSSPPVSAASSAGPARSARKKRANTSSSSATAAVQGAGLIQVNLAIAAKTFVEPTQLLLNDTAHLKPVYVVFAFSSGWRC